MNFADVIANPTVRRIAIGLLGSAIIAGSKKLGLDLTDAQVWSVGGIIMSYLLGSNAHSAAKAIAGANQAKDKAITSATPEEIKALIDEVVSARLKPPAVPPVAP